MNIGLIKGGQLGLMLIQASEHYHDDYHVLDGDPTAPCRKYAKSFTEGEALDKETVLNFAKDLDAIVIEFEHVNVEALEELEAQGVKIYPSAKILKMVQDKGTQKQYYLNGDFPTAPFDLVVDAKDAREQIDILPIVQKTRTAGYDGKGVQVIRSEEDYDKLFDQPSVLEKMVDFQAEIAVMVARNVDGDVVTWTAVEMDFHPEHNLVEFLHCPSSLPQGVLDTADELARRLAEELELVGILAVEMFVEEDGTVLINEIAPRAHNSGHHTIEACETSQFEQIARIVHGEALGNTALKSPAVMVNILGEVGHTGPAKVQGQEEAEALGNVFVHLYEKEVTKPARKMGHVTVLDQDLEKAKAKAKMVKNTLKIVS